MGIGMEGRVRTDIDRNGQERIIDREGRVCAGKDREERVLTGKNLRKTVWTGWTGKGGREAYIDMEGRVYGQGRTSSLRGGGAQ